MARLIRCTILIISPRAPTSITQEAAPKEIRGQPERPPPLQGEAPEK